MSAATGRARTEAPTARLRQAENLAALNILLGGIAHNLANPLTSIGSFLEMLPQKWSQSQEFRDRDYARVMQDLSRVREQIETLTRVAVTPDLDAGESWQVDGLAAELRLYGVGAAGTHGLVLESDLDCPKSSFSQPRDVLKQIMIILLDNAIGFAAPSGVVQFRVTGAVIDGREYVRMQVIDDGPGVSAENAAKIFEPFFSTRTGGMGVGLFVGRHLARAYGGELRLVDGRQVGAEFELLMPSHPD